MLPTMTVSFERPPEPGFARREAHNDKNSRITKRVAGS
jgi:hypothetical protein